MRFLCLLVVFPFVLAYTPSEEEEKSVEILMKVYDKISEEAKNMTAQELQQRQRMVTVAFDLDLSEDDRAEILTKMFSKRFPDADQNLLKAQAMLMVKKARGMEVYVPILGGKGNVRRVVNMFMGAQFLLGTKENRRRMFWNIVEEINSEQMEKLNEAINRQTTPKQQQ